MNNKEFLASLSAKTGYNAKQTGQMVMDVIRSITDELIEENTVGITGFGTFEVKKKLERVLVNPSTKQRMLVPPKMVVSFKPNTGMKDKVNLLKYRRSSRVNIYNLSGFEDYFYGYMAYSTGILKCFNLFKYKC